MESRDFRILNNMVVAWIACSDTMSSVSLCENDIPGSSLEGRNP